jgi:hypothetical protein
MANVITDLRMAGFLPKLKLKTTLPSISCAKRFGSVFQMLMKTAPHHRNVCAPKKGAQSTVVLEAGAVGGGSFRE